MSKSTNVPIERVLSSMVPPRIRDIARNGSIISESQVDKPRDMTGLDFSQKWLRHL